jgi:hypothetical protein
MAGNSTNGATNHQPDANGDARKTYSTPELRVFGDVAALTRSISNKSTNADGGHGAMSKTH